jgi:polyketide cyclase/dehydrase/lipid transport protein
MRKVTIRYRRDFPFAVAQAYAWLTDFRDDDPARAGKVLVARPVLERHPDRIVLDGTVQLFGRRSRGKAEVRLFPPDRWEAHIVDGQGRGSVYRYKLTPTGGGCRLDVAYELCFRRRRWQVAVWLMRPWARRELDAMWAGFARSMRAELTP